MEYVLLSDLSPAERIQVRLFSSLGHRISTITFARYKIRPSNWSKPSHTPISLSSCHTQGLSKNLRHQKTFSIKSPIRTPHYVTELSSTPYHHKHKHHYEHFSPGVTQLHAILFLSWHYYHLSRWGGGCSRYGF